MPEGAVYVGRPTKWGNPWRVVPIHRSGPFDVMFGDSFCAQSTGLETARRIAVERFRRELIWDFSRFADYRADYLHLLRGRDLACWCPLGQPCHADVLLELANGGAA